MLENPAFTYRQPARCSSLARCETTELLFGLVSRMVRPGGWRKVRARLAAVLCCAVIGSLIPSGVSATHEADHRFTVEGYVCGPDGKGVSGIDVLVKDTKVSYGQIVKTDREGYYKATFHLHNENLGDPLLVEVGGQRQDHRVQFDPKDLESERIIRVNFGTGCEARGSLPWLWIGLGGVVVGTGAMLGMKAIRSRQRVERTKGKSPGKRKPSAIH